MINPPGKHDEATFFPNMDQAVFGYEKRRGLLFWDIKKNALVKRWRWGKSKWADSSLQPPIKGHGDKLLFLDNERILFRDKRTGEVALGNLRQARHMGTLFITDSHIDGTFLSKKHDSLLIESRKSTTLWKLSSGELLYKIPVQCSGHADISESGILAINCFNHIRFVESHTGKDLHQLNVKSHFFYTLLFVDDRTLWVGTTDGSILRFSLPATW